jgi:multimeric flavodoxin WrbA
MIIRKLGDDKPRVILFQGSPRDKDTCPNMNSKSHKIVDYMLEKWSPFIDFKVFDLAVNQSKAPTIQPCKGCVSTAGGYHCHFKCSCYFKGDDKKPDLLQELDVYEHLQACDAFIIISPIHWYSLTSQVKLLFDRLVCINQTLTIEDAKMLMGKDNIKNSDITGQFAKSGKHDEMLRNHLEGKVCGFYVHGDYGADDYEGKELPDSYSDVIKDNFSIDPKSVVDPFSLQMKYSGVYSPDELIQAFYVNKGVDYYTANKTVDSESEFFERADTLMDNLLNYLDKMKEKDEEY